MNETYVEAVFWFIHDCNMERFDYMMYDALKDLEPNAKVLLENEKQESFKNPYVRKFIEMMNTYDLTKNKMVMEDCELTKIMNTIKELQITS